MATAKKNTKKPVAKKTASKKVVAGKRSKFNLSSLQKKLIIGTGIVLVAAGGYLGWSAYQDSQADAASCTASTYKQGSKGNCVKYMQQIINASGATSKISADGAFGSGTKAAVVAFQKSTKVGTKKAITADGIVGKGTWAKLCAVTQSAAATAKKNAGCGGATTSSNTNGGWTVTGTHTDKGVTYTKYLCKSTSGSGYKIKSKITVTSGNYKGARFTAGYENTYNISGKVSVAKGNSATTSLSSKVFKSNDGVTSNLKIFQPDGGEAASNGPGISVSQLANC